MLTEKESRVYNYLVEFITSNLYSPTYREIAEETQLKSIGKVKSILETLADKGYIRLDSYKKRNIRLVGYSLVKDKDTDKPINLMKKNIKSNLPTSFWKKHLNKNKLNTSS